ncbi:unnamed protein product [Victoria cruziana]
MFVRGDGSELQLSILGKVPGRPICLYELGLVQMAVEAQGIQMVLQDSTCINSEVATFKPPELSRALDEDGLRLDKVDPGRPSICGP